MTQLTQKEALNMAIQALMDTDQDHTERGEAAIAVLTKMIAQRSKPRGTRKPSAADLAKREANEQMAQEIAECLKDAGDAVAAKDLAARFEISNQKLAAVIKMVDGVEKVKIGKNVGYKLA